MTLANLNEPHHALSRQKDRKDSNIQEIGCLEGEMRRYHNTKLCKLSLQPDKQNSLLAALFQIKTTQFSFNAPTFFSFLPNEPSENLDAEMQSGGSGNHSKSHLMVSAAPLVHQELWEISWGLFSITSCDTLYITALKDE